MNLSKAISLAARWSEGHVCSLRDSEAREYHKLCHEALKLMRAQPETSRMGDEAWELFELITSVWHGKQYYFRNEDGTVYSRASHKNMSEDDALKEFLDQIGGDGNDA